MKNLMIALGIFVSTSVFAGSLAAQRAEFASALAGEPNAYGNLQVYRDQLNTLVKIASRKDLKDNQKRDHMKKVLDWAYESLRRQEAAHPYITAMVKYELDPFNQWIRTAPMPEVKSKLISSVATIAYFESYLL